MSIDATKTALLLEHKHDRPLVSGRFDPSGRFVFFGAEDNFVHRFDLKSKTATPLAAHDSWVRALGCLPSGEVLYSGGYDGRLVCWPAADDKPQPIRVTQAHDGWLRALAVSPSGQQIATCGNDNLVKLWNAADGASYVFRPPISRL
jgi:WD40 repeat protein